MNHSTNLNIEDFNYDLPDDRIALYPEENRDNSKLLIFNNGKISQNTFNRIPELLETGSLLIYNNTRVISARLHFRKESGAQIEIFCIHPHEPYDVALNLSARKSCTWKCIVGNKKKWKTGLLDSIKHNGNLKAEMIQDQGESCIIKFVWKEDLSFAEILEMYGEIPLPPYLNREPVEQDKNTYQTIYGIINGSVAAPTAGLHFTDSVFESLKKKNISTSELTLHVGAGTFKPVKGNIEDHDMHCEYFSFTKECIQSLLKHEGKIYPVGTTSLRSLESMFRIGCKIKAGKKDNLFFVDQWEVYDDPIDYTPAEAWISLLEYMESKKTDEISASTKILIRPGYKSKIVSGLITNFHQPKSTLLLLIASIIGEKWKDVYKYALENNFRFLSYGDSSLLIPEK